GPSSTASAETRAERFGLEGTAGALRRANDQRRIRRRIRRLVGRNRRVDRHPRTGVADERRFLADALICFCHELLGALTQHREDRELVTRELGVVAVDGGLQVRAAITTRTDRDVDLRELVVEAERLDDVALLARLF